MAKTVEIGPYSAYALAVAAGFVGTEEEWLKSLIGPQGEQGASITDVKINGEGHIIVTVHDPVSGEDSTIDAGDIGTVEAVEGVNAAIRQAAEQAVAAVTAQQATSVGAVQAAQSTGVQAVQQAQSTATGVVGDAQTSAVQAVNKARDEALSQVETSTEAAEQAKDAAASSAAAAAGSATDAAASKTAAATSATQAAEAKTGADSAKAAAETAQQAAESAKDSAEVAQSKAEQAETNAQSAAGEIDAGLIVETASGETITIRDSAAAKLRGLRLYGKSVQDGTPTPEAPVEIESAGDEGNISVKIQGKNLIYTVSSGSSNGVTMTANEDGTFTLNGTAVNSAAGLYFVGNYNTTNVTYPDAKYSFKVDGLQESDTTIIRGPSRIDFPGAYNAVLNYNGIISQVGIRLVVGHTYDNTIIKPMLIAGENMPDEFIPGSAPQTLTYPIPNGLPGIPVESGGNFTDAEGQQWYCDIVDFSSGVYLQNVEYINAKDKNWLVNVSWSNINGNCILAYYVTDAPYVSHVLSNKLKAVAYSSNPVRYKEYEITVEKQKNTNKSVIYISIPLTAVGEATNEAFAAYLESAGIHILVPKATTTQNIDISLTSDPLTTYKPNTTITTDSDPAAGIEVNYVADTKTYIDNKLAAISEAILGGTTNGNV